MSNYWTLPTGEQQKQIDTQTPAQVPGRYTLQNALNAGEDGMEYAVCASALFTIIVQDRYDIGGGYGVQITALGQIRNEHFATLEDAEIWLINNTPVIAQAPIWVPLPVYHSHKYEIELLKKLWQ